MVFTRKKDQLSGERRPVKTRGLRMVVRAVVILMVVVLSSLALYFWVMSERAATAQFTRSQLTVARLGARRLEEIVHHFENAILEQSRSGCTGGPAVDGRDRSDARTLDEHRSMGAVELMRIDESGRVTSTVAHDPEVLQPVFDKAAGSCMMDHEHEVCYGTTTGPRDSGLPHSVLVMIKELPACAGRGKLVLLASWDALGSLITEETSISRFSLGWILDDSGTLLYHTRHAEMSSRSIESNDGSCIECHEDFEIARMMRQGLSATGRLDVKGARSKLVAFSPLEIGGQRWSLAVSAPTSTVVAENRKALVTAVLISAFLIGLFLFVSYFLDKENRRQIKDLQANRETIEGLNAELETKVIERTKQLEGLYEEMRTIQDRYDAHQRLAILGELASTVAHEVRTPLNSLAIGAQRLLRGLGDNGNISTGKIKRIVESQQYEIQRINAYIDEYLRFSRLPRPKITRTDLNLLVERILRFFAVEGMRSGVKIHFAPGTNEAVVEVDEEQITQVLLNLLVNSVQAMPGGGHIFVETDEKDGHFVLQVRDTGVGIARECLEEVFKPFFTTKEGGTGLGLAISERIIEENGGSIDCISEQGNGTTFRIEFPKT